MLKFNILAVEINNFHFKVVLKNFIKCLDKNKSVNNILLYMFILYSPKEYLSFEIYFKIKNQNRVFNINNIFLTFYFQINLLLLVLLLVSCGHPINIWYHCRLGLVKEACNDTRKTNSATDHLVEDVIIPTEGTP